MVAVERQHHREAAACSDTRSRCYGYERIMLKTDVANERSSKAIARLGASKEGVLRHHMKRPDGSWRDSVVFSILLDEWPSVKDKLETALAKHAVAPQ